MNPDGWASTVADATGRIIGVVVKEGTGIHVYRNGRSLGWFASWRAGLATLLL